LQAAAFGLSSPLFSMGHLHHLLWLAQSRLHYIHFNAVRATLSLVSLVSGLVLLCVIYSQTTSCYIFKRLHQRGAKSLLSASTRKSGLNEVFRIELQMRFNFPMF